MMCLIEEGRVGVRTRVGVTVEVGVRNSGRTRPHPKDCQKQGVDGRPEIQTTALSHTDTVREIVFRCQLI